MKENLYIKTLENTGRLSEPAIRKAIKTLQFSKESKILDVPCGTGNHIKWMLEEYPEVNITGFDIAEEQIEYAKHKIAEADKTNSCKFITGDMNQLNFADNTFDLVWCCDGLWAGPKELGCPAEEPYDILDDMFTITKTGGKIAILFWSSQKLLPGYPFIESALNSTVLANSPFSPKSKPGQHFMRAPAWMRKVGLKNIQVQTFVADIYAPLDENKKEGLLTLFNMFWANAEQEVSKEIWKDYKNITNPESEEYILNNKDYTAMLTYTMFTGEV